MFVPESVPEVVGDGDGEEELEAVEDAATQVQVLDLSQQGGEVAWGTDTMRNKFVLRGNLPGMMRTPAAATVSSPDWTHPVTLREK